MSEILTKEIEHPLEEVFDIEPGTTIMEYVEPTTTKLVKAEEYDKKDEEIEEQFQEVYDRAMDAFDTQSDITDMVEGKYAARNAEVAANFLNTALAAAKEKSNQKSQKDKLEVTKKNVGTPGTVNNNLIVDRNDLIRAIQGDTEIRDITDEA
jgi:hypothetical protein